MTGVKEHTINNIPIARFCSLSQSQLGPVICIYHKYAGGNIQDHTIHSCVQLQDYKNKVDYTSMKLGGSQTITTHGGHIFPLLMKKNLCYIKQHIPTDFEMETLQQVIMTSGRVWDPSIYDDQISPSERLKHLPAILAGENKEIYEIEGNLEFTQFTNIMVIILSKQLQLMNLPTTILRS